jgi:SAM-dependent methyltransferase
LFPGLFHGNKEFMPNRSIPHETDRTRLRNDVLVCIVCSRKSAFFFADIEGLSYHRCITCHAIFMNPAQRLSPGEEYQHYCQHQNDPADTAYRRFLSKLVEPLLQRLPPRANGLDYGCGQGPALAAMLREAGHKAALYDPCFFPDTEPLNGLYDFIACTETIEHFYRPNEEFTRFDRMLRPGGWLALMTCFLTDDERFASWHYRREATHVVFYREATLRHIADRFGWTCEIPVKDVALMQKPPVSIFA